MYGSDYHEAFYFLDTPEALVRPNLELWSESRDLLDYGCGNASYLKEYLARGYRCSGVEFSIELVQRLSQLEPEIHFLEAGDFWREKRSLSIVHLGDVLEHLTDPLEVLCNFWDRLSPGGILVAEGPLEDNRHLALGIRKLISAVKDRGHLANHVPYHLTFANSANQKALFERAGFETLEMTISETAWPYPEKFAAAPGELIKYILARLSMAISSVKPLGLGNRFSYVGRKRA